MKVMFQTFESSMKSWDTLFNQAAEFAGSLSDEQLISISHSADDGKGVVTVWYYEDEEREYTAS